MIISHGESHVIEWAHKNQDKLKPGNSNGCMLSGIMMIENGD
jgi:hypothetical protein